MEHSLLTAHPHLKMMIVVEILQRAGAFPQHLLPPDVPLPAVPPAHNLEHAFAARLEYLSYSLYKGLSFTGQPFIYAINNITTYPSTMRSLS
jgi:hypothetical protein